MRPRRRIGRQSTRPEGQATGAPLGAYSFGCSRRSLSAVVSTIVRVSCTERPFSSAARYRSSYVMLASPISRWASMQPHVRHIPDTSIRGSRAAIVAGVVSQARPHPADGVTEGAHSAAQLACLRKL